MYGVLTKDGIYPTYLAYLKASGLSMGRTKHAQHSIKSCTAYSYNGYGLPAQGYVTLYTNTS